MAHCVWASPAEIDLLAQTDTREAHCPSANMKLASGFAPVPEFLEHGIKVGLGAVGGAADHTFDLTPFAGNHLRGLIQHPRSAAPKSRPSRPLARKARARVSDKNR
ncbi:MAG TPA: amidohydrolase family protein [Anaerolineae bacterium]|nr:amidohydrolase family protein [Anaerolineae bacterium]